MPDDERQEDRPADGSRDPPLPDAVIEEAERLTRLARETSDEAEAAAYRTDRESLLMGHGYTARVRSEDRATLVLHPEEWVEDGTVHPDRIEDIDRGIERPLEGPGSSEQWKSVAEHNRDLAEKVAQAHGDTHGRNALALADFASNHYAKPIEQLSGGEVEEFLTEYFPRNAFPTDDQKTVVGESVRLCFEAAGEESPYRH
jgi:hypothetical protein